MPNFASHSAKELLDKIRKKNKIKNILISTPLRKFFYNKLYNSKEFKSTLFNRKHKNTKLQEQVKRIRIQLILR